MKERRPNDYTQIKKVICDWTVKVNHLTLSRMLKVFVRQGVVLDKFHERTSFKQIKRLEDKSSNTQKRNQATKDFYQDFYELGKNAFYEKTVENVRGRLKVKISLKKC